MKRFLSSIWNRSEKKGSSGIISQNRILNNASYSWDTSFVQEKIPAPEELLAAAHASCFTLKLGLILGNVGYAPEEIQTASTIKLNGSSIAESYLVVKAKVPGISSERFAEYAEKAKNECVVSKALNMKISLDATVESSVKI